MEQWTLSGCINRSTPAKIGLEWATRPISLTAMFYSYEGELIAEQAVEPAVDLTSGKCSCEGVLRRSSFAAAPIPSDNSKEILQM